MSARAKFCAVVPFKGTAQAKLRLAPALAPAQRQELALAMLDDVLRSISAVGELAMVLVVTVDPAAASLAAKFGARISSDHACEGHTAAVTGAAHRLAAQGLGLLTVPGDIPLVEPDDIRALLATHGAESGFTIVPARDEMGSNAILCSPANAVPLRFGDNSFFPHLAAARARSLEPYIVHRPCIALDMDTPEDLALFLATPSHTRARALLDRWGVRADGTAATPERAAL
jgi:2-phospho-L-lactate guanylyltransferase